MFSQTYQEKPNIRH